MRGWKLFVAGVVVGVILSAGVRLALPYWPRPEPSLARFSRLRVGMTKEEVEHVLGQESPVNVPGFLLNTKSWISDDRRREIAVEFGDDGTVEQARFMVGLEPMGAGPPQEEGPPESFLDRIWRWISW